MLRGGGVNLAMIERTLGQKVLATDSIDSIPPIEPPLESRVILLSDTDPNLISLACQKCLAAGFLFDHSSFYTTREIRGRYLSAMGFSTYIDLAGNVIKLDPRSVGNTEIMIEDRNFTGDNYIDIGEVGILKRLKIILVGKRARVTIGDGSTFVDTLLNVSSDGVIEIGEDCMFASRIMINQSDAHHIFDLESHLRVNGTRYVSLGDHVWVGRGARLLPGASIGPGSIVAAEAVTSSSFGSNLVVGGNPARVIREKVIWSRDLTKRFDHETLEEAQDQKGLRYL